MAIKMIGANPIEINSDPESGFQLNIDNIVDSITNKTKAIIINSPNNPTGAVYANNALEELLKLCSLKEIKVIFDITYYEYIHSNNDTNYLSLLKNFENIIITGSFSKTFGITGLRIGYISTKSNYIDDLCKIQDTISICASSLSQQILLNLIKYEKLAIETNVNSVKSSKEILISNLINIPQLNWVHTNGAFYAFVELKNNMNSWDFTENLINTKSVLVLPGSIFGTKWKSYIRLAYGALSSDDVDEGMKRIKLFIEEQT
jgi:aspartate/methionine/tyrosine aminotransferase